MGRIANEIMGVIARLLLKTASRLSGETDVCTVCGRSARTFCVPERYARAIQPCKSPGGDVLCYECFCDRCERAGIEPPWLFAEDQHYRRNLHETNGGKNQRENKL